MKTKNPHNKTIGQPSGFDRVRAMRDADEIWLFTAFARWSGWRRLRSAIENSSANLTLVAGQNLFLTDPRVLSEWFELREKNRGQAYLHYDEPFFHPKVLLVRCGRTGFAIIGSGNLTEGGLSTNTECAVYVEGSWANEPYLNEIRQWMDNVTSTTACQELTRSVLADYRKKHKRHAAARKAIESSKANTQSRLQGSVRYIIQDFEECVKELRAILNSNAYKTAQKEHRPWEDRYLRRLTRGLALTNPQRIKSVTRDSWRIVYEGDVPLGNIRPAQAQNAPNNIRRLRKALMLVADKTLSAPERFGYLVGAKQWKVEGVAENIVSKLLLALDQEDCPILNRPVRETMRDCFGAEFAGRRARNDAVPYEGHKYAAFRKQMIRLRNALGLEDMIELDRAIWVLAQKNN